MYHFYKLKQRLTAKQLAKRRRKRLQRSLGIRVHTAPVVPIKSVLMWCWGSVNWKKVEARKKKRAA